MFNLGFEKKRSHNSLCDLVGFASLTMGKKTGMNEKAMEARARKEEAKAAATAAAGKKAEDDYWDQFANPRGKKDMKKEEEQKKRAEALARKAENRRLWWR